MGNFYFYQIAFILTRNLPLSVSYAVAAFLSDCQYLISKKDRRAIESNLRIILETDKVSSYMVREVFRYFGRYLVDFFTMTQRVNKEFIRDSVKISGIEHLNEVVNKGKGAILISAHLGNWELGGAVLGILGYPVSVVALAHKDSRVNDFFNKQREFFGTTVIQTNVALRCCLQHLRRNRIVAILADRDFGHHGLPMKFFGKKSIIPKGAALFSLQTGAPIIPGFFLKGPENKFYVTIEEPIYPPPMDKGRLNDEEIENLIKKYLSSIEDHIRKNPSQWLVFRRFETL